jgi:hypothetical protein
MKQRELANRTNGKKAAMDRDIPVSLQKLYSRTAQAGLDPEPYPRTSTDTVGAEALAVTGLLIHLNNGKSKRKFLIKDDQQLPQHVGLPFEEYQFIAGLEATWSPNNDILEAELQGDDMTRSASTLIKRLQRMFRSEALTAPEFSSIEMPYRKRTVKVALGASSDVFTLLTNHYGYRTKPVIRITGTGAKDHDEARSALLHLSDALLFYIDREYKIPMRIRSERYLFSEYRKKRVLSGETIKLKPPTTTHSTETMAFYWNARMSTGNPVSQFLYFYQVIEQYILPDPAKQGESQRLKNLLSTTMSSESVQQFIDEDTDRKRYFNSDKKANELSTESIGKKCTQKNITDAIAGRIYDIRCKIVHTKKNSPKEYILPLSNAIGDIYHDLSLIEYVAREVILSKAVINSPANQTM